MSKQYYGKNIVIKYPDEYQIIDDNPINILGENCEGYRAVKLCKTSSRSLLWVISYGATENLAYYIDELLNVIHTPYIIGKNTYVLLDDYVDIAGAEAFRIVAFSILFDDSVVEYVLTIFIANGMLHKILLSVSSDSVLDLDGSNMVNIKKDMKYIVDNIQIS